MGLHRHCGFWSLGRACSWTGSGQGDSLGGCKKCILLLSVYKNNWTEAFWKLKSRRFLRGELPLTPFCRTWLKTRNSCRKLVVSPGLAELVLWQGCVSIPGSECGQRSLTQQDHLHFEGMLCLGQVCRTQHQQHIQKSCENSTARGSAPQGCLSRDVALIEAVWES